MPVVDEPAAVWISRSALRPWTGNPRLNDGEPVRRVIESIKRFGFAAPIIARRADGEVIAGHTRLKAAEALGLDRVPVRYVDLDPADARLLALADNRLGEYAEWNMSQLQELLGEFSLSDVDLAGWSSDDLEEMAKDIAHQFAPGSIDDQGRMDERSVHQCPKCGHEF